MYNNSCPLCKEVCDHVKFCEHHPDIVIQKDQDYAVYYHSHTTIPTVLERIEVDNQIQNDEALPDLGSSNSKNDDPSENYSASDVDQAWGVPTTLL
jgi:hypothetical protein